MQDTIERLCQSVVATAPRVVSSAHPAATAAGIGAYARGGNAFDAALAACFLETIALPMKCGLAGDVVALYRCANGPLRALVSVGPAPLALADGEAIERVGPRSIGVPGAPHGYAALHRFARLALPELVAPAVRAAHEGIPWTPVALAYLDEAEEVLARFSPGHPYRIDGRRPRVGELRRMPGLGDWLTEFGALGDQLFTGMNGERLVAQVRERGGILRREDLLAQPARTLEPLRVRLGLESNAQGLEVEAQLLVTPEPTAGPRLAEVLRRCGARASGLPEAVRVERAEARVRARSIADEGTSVVVAADYEGNAVVVVHSNSFPRFGSGVVLDSGLVLNNRPGRGFDLGAPAGARNAPASGATPPTTLHAWALEREGRLDLGATPGGVNQLPWNAQAIAELVAGAEGHDAVTRPRWAYDENDRFAAEEGVVLPAPLQARVLGRFAHRSVEQIVTLRAGAAPSLAADPRVGALALGSY